MQPGVSIIVPFYNAEKTLSACLDALLAQDYAGPTEIIVVDNNSSDGSKSIVQHRDKVRVMSCRRPGPASARNEGVKVARYELLAFTDSDCVPDSAWLRHLVGGLTPNLAGVGGRLQSVRPGLIPDFVAEISFDQESHANGVLCLPYLATSNALFRRSAFDQVGFFDESFDIAGGEDNDFGWRITRAGLAVGFVSDARCLHNHPMTLWDFIVQRVRYGYGEIRLIQKYGGAAGLSGVPQPSSMAHVWDDMCQAIRRRLTTWWTERTVRHALAILSETAFFCGYLIGHWRTRPSAPVETPVDVRRGGPMCLKPWTSFELDDQRGNVLPCCWTRQTLGNLNEQSIADIWNGLRFQEFRRKMLAGEYQDMCPADCPHRTGAATEVLPTGGVTRAFRINLELLRSDVMERRTELRAMPISMRLLPSIRCNLECIMCWQRVEQDKELPDSFYEELPSFLPMVGRLVLQGGEPLMIRRCRELLTTCRADRYGDVNVSLITNGTFLSDQFLRLINGVNVPWLFVSLDAAAADTYKRIRGADFDKVCDGIRLVRRERPEIRVIIGFVVMAENVGEIVDFIELAQQLGVDFEFSPLNAAFKKGDDFGDSAFRGRLAVMIEAAERHMEAIGIRNQSLQSVKHRLWHRQFVSFRRPIVRAASGA